MATTAAIAATGNAILHLLENAFPSAGISQNGQRANFVLYNASDLQTVPAFSNKEMGFSLFLYRVNIDGSRRNLSPRVSPDGRRHPPALPLILYFLLTPWAASAETQLWLLGWAMRLLEDTTILPATLLNVPGLTTQPFHADETVEIAFDPLTIQDIGMIWDTLKQPRIIPSVAYQARIVSIESELEEHEYLPVQARQFNLGKEQQP